jgi:cell wall-associated NlpC family hydrolase
MRSGARPLAASVCLVAVAALAACGHSGGAGGSPRAAATPLTADVGKGATTTGASTTSTAADPPGGRAQPTKRAGVRQAADPQEAQSFPVPAGTQHASAATPTKAGELAVAAGAQSDAEVRRELQQMQALERSARQSQQTQSNLGVVPGGRSIGGSGALPIPAGAPEAIQRVIAGANEIADFPYVFGGGHASFVDNAYDCSGSVSYALAAGGLIGAPETSGELESWGASGPGRYITVYANAGHTYMYVDGVMFNTAGRSGPYDSRWQVGSVSNGGFVARHWPGL